MKALALIRPLFFALNYNTTSMVNLMLTLGVLTPFIVLTVLSHTLSFTGVITATLLTILATYCYNLVYIINDYMDREKDARLGTPKMTARHILGEHYLPIAVGCFIAVIALGEVAFPHVLLALVGYLAILAGLSLIHSTVQSTKHITVFAERLMKFIMPLVFITVVVEEPHVKAMLLAALLIFPLSHTQDYAFRGYLRDRLHKLQSARVLIYASYYCILDVAITFSNSWGAVAQHSSSIISFIGVYLMLSAVSDMLAPRLPWKAIDAQYDPHVAGEKRRLVTYGLLQIVVITLGGLYALLG